MTITLTREEAQQVLDAFLGIGQDAADAMDGDAFIRCCVAGRILRARLSAPEPEPVTDKYLMEVECTKCGAKQDGVLTVTVPPQPEPHCKTGSQCIGGKCPQCVVSEPEPVAWMYEYGTDHGDAVNQIFWHKNLRLEKPDGMVRNVVPLYTAPPQREWQGLTEDDVDYAVEAVFKGFDMKPRNDVEIKYLERVIKFVEAKLKEKNT
jgi:hypothetical protein